MTEPSCSEYDSEGDEQLRQALLAELERMARQGESKAEPETAESVDVEVATSGDAYSTEHPSTSPTSTLSGRQLATGQMSTDSLPFTVFGKPRCTIFTQLYSRLSTAGSLAFFPVNGLGKTYVTDEETLTVPNVFVNQHTEGKKAETLTRDVQYSLQFQTTLTTKSRETVHLRGLAIMGGLATKGALSTEPDQR